jgi:hypothetical protein
MAKKLKLYRVDHSTGKIGEQLKKAKVLVIAENKVEAGKMVNDEYGNGITIAKRVKMKKPATFVISGPILMEALNEQN